MSNIYSWILELNSLLLSLFFISKPKKNILVHPRHTLLLLCQPEIKLCLFLAFRNPIQLYMMTLIWQRHHIAMHFSCPSSQIHTTLVPQAALSAFQKPSLPKWISSTIPRCLESPVYDIASLILLYYNLGSQMILYPDKRERCSLFS